ncbi:uncharacterized protein LOC121879965 isoform X2 [Homarus americanus]|uniref:uncharacterized protein LOC121879965 isoform X2 n=1 Tax=Homarus americanus TaxID=6706 RepID=UPI001C45A088|nr:uncharacterized protein LOC121879965 isoform X2 [Homarus americanus]
MDEDNPLECKVCFTEYDDELRRPRNLPCGHTFCTHCITDTLGNGSLTCPNCRKEHYATFATEFPISYLAEALIKSLRAVRISSTTSKRPRRDSPKGISKKLESLRSEQESTVRVWITNCQQSRSQMNKYEEHLLKWKEDHRGLIELLDKVAQQNREALQSLEEEHCSLVDMRRAGIDEERRLEALLECLTQANSAQEVDTAIDDADVCGTGAQDWNYAIQKCFPSVKAVHTSALVRESTKKGLEVINRKSGGAVATPVIIDSGKTIQDKVDLIIGHSSLTENTPQAIRPKEKFDVNMFAVVEDEPVYSAKISLQGDKICLHYLQDKPVPPEAKTVKHSQLMSVVDPNSTLVFLDLAWEGSSGGRIYIRLSQTNTNNWAQQFLALCTAQQGPTYANTHFLGTFRHVQEEGVLAGDYEHNNGNGGAALQKGLASSQCTGTWTEGTVSGRKEDDATAAQFYIITRVNSARVGQAVIGQVESGLGVVRSAVSLSDVRKVTVVDCGVVLHL